jgi:aldehyde dehydrogenase family 7 protein A1
MSDSKEQKTHTAETKDLTYEKYAFLKELGIEAVNSGVYHSGKFMGSGEVFYSVNPCDHKRIAAIYTGTVDEYGACVKSLEAAKKEWVTVPMPVRGQIVRKIGEKLRKHLKALGSLVSLEVGKILGEGIGEVQEAIDICDLAVGLSRTISGQMMESERAEHVMMERYLPLKGHVGVISAFNFPCAVFFWNLAISMVCGNTNLWKPADTTPLVSIACTRIISSVLTEEGFPGVVAMCLGRGDLVGEALIHDKRIELVSFTGSTKIGKRVNLVLAERFGKRILELGSFS